MNVDHVCQAFFHNSLSFLHTYRRNALIAMSLSLVHGASLTLTSIGRHLPGAARVKHKIKRVDRFLGNPLVQRDIPDIYQAITQRVISGLSCCIIAVDWSSCWRQDYQMLRASLLCDGRAIPLLNRLEPLSRQGNHQVHIQFLNQLRAIIGPEKKVVIVTDAGFLSPWFLHVQSLGWHFVGRLRNNIHSMLDSNREWVDVESLTQNATSTPSALGAGVINKKGKGSVRGYFYHCKPRPQGRRTKRIKHGAADKEYRRGAKMPWLIFSSVDSNKARNIINIYKKRMQIEQNFRDEKNRRFGFGLRHSGSTDMLRLGVLCMLSAVASTLLWFIGYMLEEKGKQFEYQANTTRRRRILSYQMLVRNVVLHEPDFIEINMLKESFIHWQKYYEEHIVALTV